MSLFPSHDLSLNRYYYTFYSYHPNTPDALNCLVYDQDQTLVETQDISFNGKNMSEMMAFVENSNANPYAIGKAETDYRSMDLTFGTVYKKSFQEKQRQKLMTYLNGNYKNVHGTSRSVFTVSASGGKYYVGGYTDPAPDLLATSEGYYVFDQSDSTNVSHPLVLSTQDGSSTYYSSMFTEGTQGSLNGYTIVDISAGTPDLHYYCTAHSGMGGQLLNFGSAIPYTVSVVYNDTYGQEIYQVAELANYYTDTSGIYLNTGSKYAIDLSLLNGTSFNPVIGTTNDISSSIISDTSIVNRVGDILYVRPIVSNLYLFDQTVALMAKPLENGYYVKTVQNWTGTSVFTLMAPTESTGIIQPDLSFNIGDVVLFHVGHSSMDNFNLVFGTSVDDSATTLDSNYVSRSGDIITLDLTGYSGGAVYYFEDSSANMGYVEAPEASSPSPNMSNLKIYIDAQSDNRNGTSLTNLIDSTKNATNVGEVTYYPNIGGRGSYYLPYEYYAESGSTQASVILPDILTSNTFTFSIYYYTTDSTLSEHTRILGSSHGATQELGHYRSINIGKSTRIDGAGDPGITFYTHSTVLMNKPGTTSYNTWHHMCVTHDGNTTILYLNGVNIGSSTLTLNMVEPLILGGYYDGNNNYTNIAGYYFDAVHVYDTVLSASEVTALYNKPYVSTSTVNVYPVTVSGGEFFIDTGSGAQSKPPITFTDGETYVFDQSDESNAGYPIVFGVTKDSTPYYTNDVTVVGTPGQPGAYTGFDYTGTTALFYFSSGAASMGYVDPLSYHTNATTNNISGSSFTNLVNSNLNGTINGTLTYETDIGGRPCYLVPKTGAAISLPASLPTNSCTFSAYFYRTSATIGNWTRLVGLHTTSVYNSVQTGLNSIGTTTTEKIVVYADSASNMYTGNPIAIYDEWIHFCITYYNNGSSSSGKIYINGVNETTYSNSTLDIEQYVIGGYGDLSNPQPYAGFYLNDVRVYNKVLSDSEVSSLYDYISY
jgi:hypothetical protein